MDFFSWTTYHEFFIPMLPMEEAFSPLHVTLMEFFNTSPTITPKKGISNSIKRKREKEEKRKGEKSIGGYMSHPTF